MERKQYKTGETAVIDHAPRSATAVALYYGCMNGADNTEETTYLFVALLCVVILIVALFRSNVPRRQKSVSVSFICASLRRTCPARGCPRRSL